MERFGVLIFAVSDYPDPPGPLGSAASAEGLSGILVGDGDGVRLKPEGPIGSLAELRNALDDWVEDRDRPSSTVLCFIGHGAANGLAHNLQFPKPNNNTIQSLYTKTLSDWIHRDGEQRRSDESSWLVVVLDCCDADVGAVNLIHALTQVPLTRPRNVAIWPTTPTGASYSGEFAASLTASLATFNENDEQIRLAELFRRTFPDVETHGFVPSTAFLQNPIHSERPTVMPLDAHAELNRIVADLPSEMRGHFLEKARGAESGHLEWHFSGREREVAELCDWIADVDGSSMKVVTGAAGSGKSAILGRLATLTNEELVGAYATSGLAPGIENGPRPPPDAFGAVVHLTGKTQLDVITAVASQLRGPADVTAAMDSGLSVVELMTELKTTAIQTTLLVDALDEAQEPLEIAGLLRELSDVEAVRVIVGTRRSLNEVPGEPVDELARELIDGLGAADEALLVVGREDAAVRNYIARRLAAPGSPYATEPARIEALVDRIAAVDELFLFARLATAELLARPAMDADAPELAFIEGGYRDTFIAAMDRIRRTNPDVAAMVEVLAYARGRGIPETDGTWLAAARGFAPNVEIASDAVRRVEAAAASYVTLDGESGQAVYRLAHRTFVEILRAPAPRTSPEARVAKALFEVVRRRGTWVGANYYLVRYLLSHLDAGAMFVEVAELLTNAEWMLAAIDMLGIEGLIDAIPTSGIDAREAIDPQDGPAASVLAAALSRGRVALRRDPTELAAQLRARLRDHAHKAVAGLGDRIGVAAQRPYLAMRAGNLDAHSTFDTTYSLAGQVRALAFGRFGGELVLAIGVDDRVHFWNPRSGGAGVFVVQNNGDRVTDLAFGEFDGRTVIVVTAGYDGRVVVRLLPTGDLVAGPFDVASPRGDFILGTVEGRPALLGCTPDLVAFDLAAGHERTLFHFAEEYEPIALFEHDGKPIVVLQRGLAEGFEVRTVLGESGETVWKPMVFPERFSLASGLSEKGAVRIVGFSEPWLTAWDPVEGEKFGPRNAREGRAEPRAIAAARLTSKSRAATVVATVPDEHHSTLVELMDLTQPDAAAITASLVDDPTVLSELAGHYPHLRGLGVADSIAPPEGEADLVKRRASSSKVSPRRKRRGDPLTLEAPQTWPVLCGGSGLVGGRPAFVVGSIGGAIWVWDKDKALLAGPFCEVPPHVLSAGRRLIGTKHGSINLNVNAVALGSHPNHGDIVAAIVGTTLRLYVVGTQEQLDAPLLEGLIATSVALGHVGGRDVLVSGSKSGVIGVYDLATNDHLCGLTLDEPVGSVWVVGPNSITALCGSQNFVLDVVDPGPR